MFQNVQGETLEVCGRPGRGLGAVVRVQDQPGGRAGLQGEVRRGQPGRNVRLGSGAVQGDFPELLKIKITTRFLDSFVGNNRFQMILRTTIAWL